MKSLWRPLTCAQAPDDERPEDRSLAATPMPISERANAQLPLNVRSADALERISPAPPSKPDVRPRIFCGLPASAYRLSADLALAHAAASNALSMPAQTLPIIDNRGVEERSNSAKPGRGHVTMLLCLRPCLVRVLHACGRLQFPASSVVFLLLYSPLFRSFTRSSRLATTYDEQAAAFLNHLLSSCRPRV